MFTRPKWLWVVACVCSIFLCTADLSTTGCSGGRGGPPSGEPELPGPTALRFPKTVSVDVSTTASGEFGALNVHEKKFLVTSGQFSQEISMASDISQFVQQFADELLSPLKEIVVPIGSDVTSHSGILPQDDPFFAGASVLIDFAKFDSGKEETQNCSGSTAGDIVCFCISIQDQKLMCGFFTSIPTETNNGAGHLWIRPPDVFFSEEEPPHSDDFQMALTWDHEDLANKTTEMFFAGALSSQTTMQQGHAYLNRLGAEEEISMKTVKMSVVFPMFEGQTAVTGGMKHVGRWKEDGIFWSGQVDFDFGSFSQENLNICASLISGDPVADSNCVDAGIDTDAEEFTDFGDPAETAFPGS